MKRYIIIFSFIFLLLISLNIKYQVLILKNVNTNEIIFLHKAQPKDEFTMEWIHSVELQPWQEIFKIDNDYNIILDRTRFKSFGAGVPDYAGEETLIENGYITFKGINQKIDTITYGISNFSKHTFYYKNYKLRLYKYVNDSEGINISIHNMNILEYYIDKMTTRIQ